MSARKPYEGINRGLVIGIDVGTTFSGVSYCILDPGIVPIIQGVNRYPAQERVGGDAKIPSVLYYDQTGLMRAAGAEALQESYMELALDENWVKAEWFKLHLRPRDAVLVTGGHIPPLPPRTTMVQVFGDFLRYLYDCTQLFIEETHAGGAELWASVEARTEFVLTHPNGWEGAQQAMMRNAAVYGGLVPDTMDGYARIHFVTEGEASLHFCIGNNYAAELIKSGEGVSIVDAGGGTVDLSAYYLAEPPNQFEEVATATCHLQGSVYVSRRARAFVEKKLSGSRYGTADDLDYITQCFDKTTKLGFNDSSRSAFIKFGTARDTEPPFDIKFGQLKLQGSEVEAFFEPSLAAIREAVKEQQAASRVPITSVLLVGGFAASNWLFSNLQSYLVSTGLRVTRPDGHLGKAVSDGAVAFFLDRSVSVRVARITLGTKSNRAFNENDEDHRGRAHKVIRNVAGNLRIPNAFRVVLAKGARVSETTVWHQRYRLNAMQLDSLRVDIYAYRGTNPNPQWIDDEPDLYTLACTVIADVSSLGKTLEPETTEDGKKVFKFEFDVELLFGKTEFEARICWQQDGESKRSPAKIVYDVETATDLD